MAGIGPKEQNAIDDVLSKFQKDKSFFAGVGECGESLTPLDGLGKKVKMSKRLIAVSKYRVFCLTKAMSSFKAEEDYPIVRILEFGGGQNNTVWIKVAAAPGKIVYAAFCLQNVREFTKVLRERYRQHTWAWPPQATATLQIPENMLDSLDPNFKMDAAGGFPQTYKAWCNLRGTPASSHVVQYIRDLASRNITDLDLGKCPGGEMTKTSLVFDPVTLGCALQNNPYFRSVIFRDIMNPAAAAGIAAIFSTNSTMTRIATSRTSSELPPNFGEALGQNRYHNISYGLLRHSV